MDPRVFILKALRRGNLELLHWIRTHTNNGISYSGMFEKNVELFDQAANDRVRQLIEQGKPLMVAKLGTVELTALAGYRSCIKERYSLRDYWEYIQGYKSTIWWGNGIKPLCDLAGFFPNDETLLPKFYDLYVESMREIDLLGSYQRAEGYFKQEFQNATRINIDGYYAAFFFERPWTEALRGKRVLVVHPFKESIERQFPRLSAVWKAKQVMPEFELVTVQAVQTIAGQKSDYPNWFAALEVMQDQIASKEFDIALIGCGAYGLPLAAHVKKMGKQAIHLGGWLQVLFGIKGKRWVDDPRMAPFINDAWVNPLPSEIPEGFKKVENGCYW